MWNWPWLLVIAGLVFQPCSSRSLTDEDSVVSVYTTPTTAGTTAPLDVYQQIAVNIAERITSPFYKLLGFGTNNTQTQHHNETTPRPWDKLELLDDLEDVTKPDLKPLNNDLPERDVEELSGDAARKNDRKPEKLTLFSNYLPVSGKIVNDTANELDSEDDLLSLDDIEDLDEDVGANEPRLGQFTYMLELIGSVIQLLWGGFLALFRPSSSS